MATEYIEIALDILRALRGRQDGALTDPTGFSTATLAELLGEPVMKINAPLRYLDKAGMVQREVRGKRTYRIGLTQRGRSTSTLEAVETALRPVAVAEDQTAQIKRQANRADARTAKPAPEPELEPERGSLTKADINALGAALLDEVIRRAHTTETDADELQDLRDRLGRADREIAKLRQVQIAHEKQTAELTSERDDATANLAKVNETLADTRGYVANLERRCADLHSRLARKNGATIAEQISPATRAELDRLVRQSPGQARATR